MSLAKALHFCRVLGHLKSECIMSANSAILPSAGRQNEPSMEEILASIRRIISDDTPTAKKEDSPAPDAPLQMMEEDDILDLAEVSSIAPRAPAPAPSQENSLTSLENALGLSKPVQPEPAPPPVRPALPEPVAPPPALKSVSQLEERILSQETGAIVGQAIQSLARQAAAPVVPGRSMEEVVVDALRPVLRTWLDDHLPGIVERLVKAEIERVTRGG
jgi:uncharacterized protein